MQAKYRVSLTEAEISLLTVSLTNLLKDKQASTGYRVEASELLTILTKQLNKIKHGISVPAYVKQPKIDIATTLGLDSISANPNPATSTSIQQAREFAVRQYLAGNLKEATLTQVADYLTSLPSYVFPEELQDKLWADTSMLIEDYPSIANKLREILA